MRLRWVLAPLAVGATLVGFYAVHKLLKPELPIHGGRCDEEFPHLREIVVVNGNGGLSCSGVVLDDSWVLTAGHCAGEGLRVQALSLSGKDDVFEVETTKHPCFMKQGNSYAYDLALLKLKLKKGQKAPKSIPLEDLTPAPEDGTVRALAWGKPDPNVKDADGKDSFCLVSTESMPILNHQGCWEEHCKADPSKLVGNEEFCAGADTSSVGGPGASGGGVFSVDHDGNPTALVGIVSDIKSQGPPEDPWDIHTRLDIPWIKAIMEGKKFECVPATAGCEGT